MAWSQKLTQLNDVLGDLVSDKDSITKYVRASGLKPQNINTNGNALDIWSEVLSEADKRDKVGDLIKSVLIAYPENPFLKSALRPLDVNYSLSPDIDSVTEWQPYSTDELEVLTAEESTLLPINFLEIGIMRSKAVAKVSIKAGSVVNVGTGFLFRVSGIDKLLFMTNYHVINTKETIPRTQIIFNYELDVKGNSKASSSFEIDPQGPWYLSPVNEFDVAIFALKATEEELGNFPHINLAKVTVKQKDSVNIIQHPAGELKQISLYHNFVTSTDERVVQYLTDTLKGSSGAPVFNSQWDVVALHHSGGARKPGEAELPLGFKSRNEGIHINKIIDFVIDSHKKS